jgi:gas vesicle protein
MSDQLSDYANYGEGASPERNNAGLALSLLFIGLAIGAVAALLCAPKTGKQMRRTLRRKYEDAREAMEDFGDQAGDWVEKSSDWADKASDWADKAKAKVKPVRRAFGR